MQKKKAKKKTAKKKTAAGRSQKVNKPAEPAREVPKGSKVICINLECKLRRAGCYGYEACPGYKSKD